MGWPFCRRLCRQNQWRGSGSCYAEFGCKSKTAKAECTWGTSVVSWIRGEGFNASQALVLRIVLCLSAVVMILELLNLEKLLRISFGVIKDFWLVQIYGLYVARHVATVWQWVPASRILFISCNFMDRHFPDNSWHRPPDHPCISLLRQVWRDTGLPAAEMLNQTWPRTALIEGQLPWSQDWSHPTDWLDAS